MKTQNKEEKTGPFTANGIPKALAKDLIAYHRKNHENLPDYTRSVWFPIKQIRNMLSRLDLADANGIRVYFGQYSKEIFDRYPVELGSLPTSYQGKCNVIFVATKGKVDVPGEDNLDKGLIPIMDPEDRGMLCPPNTGCDCASELIDKPDPFCP